LAGLATLLRIAYGQTKPIENNETMLQIVFNKSTGQFATVQSRNVASAMMGIGNAEGFDRGMPVNSLPRNTVAKLSGTGKLAKLEIIAPNGETLHQFGGRIHLKAEAEKIRPYVASLLNEKKGGEIITF